MLLFVFACCEERVSVVYSSIIVYTRTSIFFAAVVAALQDLVLSRLFSLACQTIGRAAPLAASSLEYACKPRRHLSRLEISDR